MTDTASAGAPAWPTINPRFVDLSHYDDLQDIGKVKAAGYLGIVNKVTEGPGMVDRTFAIRRPVVLGAGLKYGAYHFLRPGNLSAQAQHFLSQIGDPTGLLLAADWEVPGVSVADLKIFLQTVHDKIGRWPVVYSYASMLMEQLGSRHPDPLLAQCRLWIAAYNSHPYWPEQIWPKPWGWQFTGDGNGPGPKQIPGIVLPGSRGIDINSFDGSDDELTASWAA
jgi:lysozyme